MSGDDRHLALRSAALLFGGAALGLLVNAARRDGVAVRGFEPPTSCSAEASGPAPAAPVVEISPREASVLCSTPGVLFADTRAADRFDAGHVADAVHLPCDATEAGVQAILAHLTGATTVIVYGDSSDDGRAVAETLARRGLRQRLYVLRGGFAAWETDGLACASGPPRETQSLTSVAGPQP